MFLLCGNMICRPLTIHELAWSLLTTWHLFRASVSATLVLILSHTYRINRNVNCYPKWWINVSKMSAWTLRHLISPTTCLFLRKPIHVNNKETISALLNWHLSGENLWYSAYSLHKGPVMRKMCPCYNTFMSSQVSDLSSQMWCEQQLEYTFTMPTVPVEDVVMTKGSEMHLERGK